MQEFLKLPKEDRKLAIEQTAARKGWVASSAEKDFWVCWALEQLFTLPELTGHLTFKGGTSLSKAWGLIDRFSEDIDLTVGRDTLGFGGENSPERAPSAKQQAKRLKALREACGTFVRNTLLQKLSDRFTAQLDADGWQLVLDPNDPDGQTLLFFYLTHFGGEQARYVRPIVKIEFGARSDPWPSHERPLLPVIAEVFPQLFAKPETIVHALAPERTFWEKAMLLHEETYRPAEKLRRPRMARHYYDLYRLIQSGIAAKAVEDIALFKQVLAHRSVFFSQSWVDYQAMAPETLRLSPLPNQEQSWRQDYIAMQEEMFSQAPPDFDTVLDLILQFEATTRGPQ
ncbi:MAG TPA: nucleotidyl transferase AbiEii/AbiGii toxin family protein [Duganella sp.]|nr:nucleotidyl transferase AbiEii/AbiGii toxin family protein [Duganella sp.]